MMRLTRVRGLCAALFLAGVMMGQPKAQTVAPDPLGEFIQTLPSNQKGASPSQASLQNDVLMHAMSMVGVLYRRGGNSSETGLDCSGFVRLVFSQSAQIALPRTSKEQSGVGKVIDATALQAGDLVFFNTLKRPYSHVGIYIGEGQFVHAPRPGAKVRLEKMNQRYWTQRFEGARRLLGE